VRSLWEKLTWWVDKKTSKVSLGKRLIAYLIDWFLGGIIGGFPAVLIFALVTDSSDMFGSLYDLPALDYPTYWSYIIGISCLVVGLIYYVYIPLKKYPGQTLGKKIMKIKIMRVDGDPLNLKTLIIRQVIGLMLLEGTAVVVSIYLWQMLTLATKFYIENYSTIVTYAITLLSTILVYITPSRRSIHDYMAKTRVALEEEVYVAPQKEKNKARKSR